MLRGEAFLSMIWPRVETRVALLVKARARPITMFCFFTLFISASLFHSSSVHISLISSRPPLLQLGEFTATFIRRDTLYVSHGDDAFVYRTCLRGCQRPTQMERPTIVGDIEPRFGPTHQSFTWCIADQPGASHFQTKVLGPPFPITFQKDGTRPGPAISVLDS